MPYDISTIYINTIQLINHMITKVKTLSYFEDWKRQRDILFSDIVNLRK